MKVPKNESAQFDWTKINIFSLGKRIFVSGNHLSGSNEIVLSVMPMFFLLKFTQI